MITGTWYVIMEIYSYTHTWYQYVANRWCSGTCTYPIFSHIYVAVLSYIVPGTWYLVPRACYRARLYSQWRLCQLEHISPPTPKNSNRFWTRAEVDGGHNKGPPQTPQGAKSVPRWWCARDKPQWTHVHTNTHTKEVITILLYKPTLWEGVLGIPHGHLHTGDR